MSKLLLLTLNEQEEKAIDKIITAIADYISLEAVQTIPVPILRMSFPGLEIRQNQRRVFRGGEEVNLTRLEYSTLISLLPIPALSSHKNRFLKLFGTWIAIAAIRALRA